MKKLNETELSKITGGFSGLGFDPTVSFIQRSNYPNFLSKALSIFRGKKSHKK